MGIFLPEKRVLQDIKSCPSAVNKCPFKRTYYFIFCKECFIFGYIICCPFRMKCLAPYTVPLGPINKGVKSLVKKKFYFPTNLGLINHYSLSQSSQDFYGISATIRIGCEMLCLPYAGFLKIRLKKNGVLKYLGGFWGSVLMNQVTVHSMGS